MLLNTNKVFGEINGLNDIDLNFMEILFSGMNGISRVTWGLLLDNFKFKHLYSVLLFAQVNIIAYIS